MAAADTPKKITATLTPSGRKDKPYATRTKPLARRPRGIRVIREGVGLVTEGGVCDQTVAEAARGARAPPLRRIDHSELFHDRRGLPPPRGQASHPGRPGRPSALPGLSPRRPEARRRDRGHPHFGPAVLLPSRAQAPKHERGPAVSEAAAAAPDRAEP